MRLWHSLSIAALVLASQAGAATVERQVLDSVAGPLLTPAINRWHDSNLALARQSQDFCAKPDKAGLQALRQAWVAAVDDWQQLDPVMLGPLIDRRTQRELNAWPPRQTLIEEALAASGETTPQSAARLGASARGYPALEFLLFAPRTTTASTLAGRPCALMQALATLITQESAGVRADWEGFARQWGQPLAGSTSADAETLAIGDFVNLLIAGLDGVRVRKLEKPLERFQATGTALDRLEAWRSGRSLAAIHRNVQSLQRLIAGQGDAPALAALLRERGQGELAQRLLQATQTALQRIDAVPVPLQTAIARKPASVREALKALSQLQNLLEQDVAAALHIDLSFNANDGD